MNQLAADRAVGVFDPPIIGRHSEARPQTKAQQIQPTRFMIATLPPARFVFNQTRPHAAQ